MAKTKQQISEEELLAWKKEQMDLSEAQTSVYPTTSQFFPANNRQLKSEIGRAHV